MILLTIHQYNVPNLYIIYKAIIINTDSVFSADASFDGKTELLSLLEQNRLHHIATSNLGSLHGDNRDNNSDW